MACAILTALTSTPRMLTRGTDVSFPLFGIVNISKQEMLLCGNLDYTRGGFANFATLLTQPAHRVRGYNAATCAQIGKFPQVIFIENRQTPTYSYGYWIFGLAVPGGVNLGQLPVRTAKPGRERFPAALARDAVIYH
jgi:hypothetical protein